MTRVGERGIGTAAAAARFAARVEGPHGGLMRDDGIDTPSPLSYRNGPHECMILLLYIFLWQVHYKLSIDSC